MPQAIVNLARCSKRFKVNQIFSLHAEALLQSYLLCGSGALTGLAFGSNVHHQLADHFFCTDSFFLQQNQSNAAIIAVCLGLLPLG